MPNVDEVINTLAEKLLSSSVPDGQKMAAIEEAKRLLRGPEPAKKVSRYQSKVKV